MTLSSAYTPPMDPLVILHEDSDIVVVDKPAGLLSVPGRGAHQAVLPTALLVHRLDRDT